MSKSNKKASLFWKICDHRGRSFRGYKKVDYLDAHRKGKSVRARRLRADEKREPCTDTSLHASRMLKDALGYARDMDYTKKKMTVMLVSGRSLGENYDQWRNRKKSWFASLRVVMVFSSVNEAKQFARAAGTY